MLKMKQYIKKAMAVLLVAMLVAGIAAPAAEAAVKKVTVTTQAELEAALAEAAKTGEKIKIKIKSADKTTFTIPEGNYLGVKLVVKAENAKIKNHGAVRALEVKDAKKFVEFATGNTIEIEDSKVEVNVKKGASVENLKFTKAEAENTVVINGTVGKVAVAAEMEMNLVVNGAVETVSVKAAATVAIAGKTETALTVKVTAAAEGAAVETSVPVTLETKVTVDVKLEAGAEGSEIVTKAEDVEVKVENNTEDKVVIKDTKGNETKVEAGETTEDTTTEDTGSTGGTTGGSTGGYVPSVPSTPTPTPTPTPEVKITPTYNEGNKTTIYTLTGADKFEDLKSAIVTITKSSNGDTISVSKKVTVDAELLRLQGRAELSLSTPNQMESAADRWDAYTIKTIDCGMGNVTIEGTEGNAAKKVSGTFLGVTLKNVDVTLKKENSAVVVEVKNLPQSIGSQTTSIESMKITMTSATSATVVVSRASGDKTYTITRTSNTLTIGGADTREILKFAEVTK